MQTFIAGFDAGKFDLSDWDINPIPVYFNPTGLPGTLTPGQVEQMIQQACASWSLRYSHDLVYMGRIANPTRYEAIVLTYSNSAHLATIVNAQVNGLCRYHVKHQNPDGKFILWGAEIHINYDNRPLANDFALGTIMHEFGHACGIHGHLDDVTCVMNTYGMGVYKLQLKDVQMLDRWNPYPVELNKDFSLSCPAVQMPDGHVKWVDLRYTGHPMQHSWSLQSEIPWDGPRIDCVTVGDACEWQGYPGQRIKMAQVVGQGLSVKADLVLLGNGNIVLEYAE